MDSIHETKAPSMNKTNLDERFSELRSLMHKARLSAEDVQRVQGLCRDVFIRDPELYEAQWVSYMSRFTHHWKLDYEERAYLAQQWVLAPWMEGITQKESALLFPFAPRAVSLWGRSDEKDVRELEPLHTYALHHTGSLPSSLPHLTRLTGLFLHNTFYKESFIHVVLKQLHDAGVRLEAFGWSSDAEPVDLAHPLFSSLTALEWCPHSYKYPSNRRSFELNPSFYEENARVISALDLTRLRIELMPGDEAFDRFCFYGFGEGMQMLDLYMCRLSDRSALRLARDEQFAEVKHMDLRMNYFSQEAIDALRDSGRLGVHSGELEPNFRLESDIT